MVHMKTISLDSYKPSDPVLIEANVDLDHCHITVSPGDTHYIHYMKS